MVDELPTSTGDRRISSINSITSLVIQVVTLLSTFIPYLEVTIRLWKGHLIIPKRA